MNKGKINELKKEVLNDDKEQSILKEAIKDGYGYVILSKWNHPLYIKKNKYSVSSQVKAALEIEPHSIAVPITDLLRK